MRGVSTFWTKGVDIMNTHSTIPTRSSQVYVQLDQRDITNDDLSAIPCGLYQRNEFFLKLKKLKTIEELRETVRLADQCRSNPPSTRGVVQAMTHENPQDKPIQLIHNTQRNKKIIGSKDA